MTEGVIFAVRGIARHTDYAARIVLHLASLEPGTQVTIEEIAARRLLPTPFVRRVLSRLVSAGILVTSRGRGGGVRLARPASRISLLDVVAAMEGGLTLNRCVDHPMECPLTSACPVHQVWTDTTRKLETMLSAVKFDRLAAKLALPGGRASRQSANGSCDLGDQGNTREEPE